MKKSIVVGVWTLAVASAAGAGALALNSLSNDTPEWHSRDLAIQVRTQLDSGLITEAEAVEIIETELQERFRRIGDHDCSDFKKQKQAQEFFEREGGKFMDLHKLDSNDDDRACETLP